MGAGYHVTNVKHKMFSREKGGAYGGGARHGSDGMFRFFSYRDPHSISTIEHFQKSLRWLVNGSFTEQDLDEAKLSVFQAVSGRGLNFAALFPSFAALNVADIAS